MITHRKTGEVVKAQQWDFDAPIKDMPFEIEVSGTGLFLLRTRRGGQKIIGNGTWVIQHDNGFEAMDPGEFHDSYARS